MNEKLTFTNLFKEVLKSIDFKVTFNNRMISEEMKALLGRTFTLDNEKKHNYHSFTEIIKFLFKLGMSKDDIKKLFPIAEIHDRKKDTVLKFQNKINFLLKEKGFIEGDNVAMSALICVGNAPYYRKDDGTRYGDLGCMNINSCDLATRLIWGAVFLGEKEVVRIFFNWLSGEPMETEYKYILVGLNTKNNETLSENNDGIKLYASKNSKIFSLSKQYLDYDRTILSFKTTYEPCFFSTDTNALKKNPYGHIKSNPSLGIDRRGDIGKIFIDAMALECDSYVEPSDVLEDYGVLAQFSIETKVKLAWRYRNVSDDPLTHTISKEQFKKSFAIFKKLGKKENEKLDIPIMRWLRSKKEGALLEDRLIDLRIALEALYLNKDARGGEKGFRVALCGAWDISEPSNRKENYDILKKLYNDASNALHGTMDSWNPKKLNNTRDNLKRAQRICRQGILSYLERDLGSQDYLEVILRGHEEAPHCISN